MTKSLPLTLLTSAALLSATAALAATTPATTPVAKPVATAHVTKTTHVVTTNTTHATAGAKPAGRMVTAKLANGKTVTYNCALPGNAAKKACK